MSLTLSSSDLAELTRAIQLLVSPLDHAHVDQWRSAVNQELRELLLADSAGFLLPVSEGLMLYSDEHDPDELAAYPDVIAPDMADGTPMWEQMIRSGVDTLANMYGRHYDRYLGSAYYNEYAGANGAHDTLTAAISLGGVDARSMATLHFWHARPDGRRFGAREVALLRLLFPAFRAGVESYVRWNGQREDLLHTLDGLGQAALVCDRTGNVLHQTPALDAALKVDSEAAALRAELHAIAQEVCRIGGIGSGGNALGGELPGRLVREVRTRAARYRLCGCLYSGPSANGATLALVSLERVTPALPSLEMLRERFGLTRRQAEVARLLARRKTNGEIADELFISLHTARHHTEAVLSTLGIRDRRLVAERLQAPGAE